MNGQTCLRAKPSVFSLCCMLLRACVRACVRVCVRACVRVCVLLEAVEFLVQQANNILEDL